MLIDKLSPPPSSTLADDAWLTCFHHPRLDAKHTRAQIRPRELQVFREFHHHLRARVAPDPDSPIYALFVGIVCPPDTLLPENPKIQLLLWIQTNATQIVPGSMVLSESRPHWLYATTERYGLEYDGTLYHGDLVLPPSRCVQLANLDGYVPAPDPNVTSLGLDHAFLAYHLPKG